MTNQDKTTDAATTETGAPTALRAPSESTAASGSTTAEVVDVTADCRLQLARPPTPSPPIRVSKRVAKRKAVLVETEKTKKGKKKLVRDDVAPAPQAEVPSVAEERAPSMQESAAATTVGQAVSMASTSPRRSTGFDLTEFMSSFNPGVGSEARSAPPLRGELPVATPSLSAQYELRLLRQELVVLRGQVAGVRQSLAVRTEPNDQGELPAGTVVELSCDSFPEQVKKAEGEYIPASARAGSLREAECVRFKTTPAVLMALFSDRLGSHGLIILHFREEDDRSSVASTSCRSYEDILDGIHGLTRMGEAMWHDHMLLLTERLRYFVSKNNSADPEGLPARVKLVLLYVNKWLGEALGHLQVDNPTWWGGFSCAVEAIDYKSPDWTMSLVNTLSQAGHQSGTTDRDQQRTRDIYGRREKSVPDDIRALVPTNRRGEEPCLPYLGGVMCSSGTRDKCGHPKRVHEWPSTSLVVYVSGLKILSPVAEVGTKSSGRRAAAEETEATELSLNTGRTVTANLTVPCVQAVVKWNRSPTQQCNFVRRTRMPLPALVELVRGQTETDYRSNKRMVPEVIAQVCKDYPHLNKLQLIAAEGVRVEFTQDVPPQSSP
ncbi:hypothetical protein PHMEG_00025882 [Phytophthora megakarya]|uniref:Uncharacterized protein n=1 Tax=Phytophthora megakarya TaxID=4795 RepID=A0A225VB29_9STRA|nr:hypothetical protein PHMEG_00025882 [Phytophthora megakarya]